MTEATTLSSVQDMLDDGGDRDTFEFVCHFRRTPDGRVLLLGLPKHNEPIADQLMPDMGDAGGLFALTFPKHQIHDRTEFGKGRTWLDLVEDGFSAREPQ